MQKREYLAGVMITTIIPCYNSAQFLGDAIESVLRQSRLSQEIIVVDDCSVDDSRKIAAKYPVRVLQTRQNSGHAAARNVGIEAASTDVIAWLDADDYWNSNHLDVVVGLLERFPQAAVAFTAVKEFGANDRTLAGFPCSGEPRNIFWNSFDNTVVPAMSAAVRRVAIERVGGYDARIRIAPDYDLWLRMSQEELFVSSEEVTSNYRRHSGQISSHPNNQIRSVYESRFRLLSKLQATGQAELHEQAVKRICHLWDRDLSCAWHTRRLDRLRFLLSLREFIPRSTPSSRGIRLRALLPDRVVRMWDCVRPGCRC